MARPTRSLYAAGERTTGGPLAAWLGNSYLASFEERVGAALGLALPLAAAAVMTLLITLLAALRHVRQALALQPIEALR